MKTKTFRTVSILASILLLLVTAMVVSAAIARSNLAKQYPTSVQLVYVGGYRLHINCVGHSNPTVILEVGMVDYSLTWAYQPTIAKNTRVCSYDRAGYGWSETSPGPRTASNEVVELHRLLVNVNIQGPYMLVGQSIPSFTDAENQQLWKELQTLQSELVALSSAGKRTIAE